jgi:hypothetical protein
MIVLMFFLALMGIRSSGPQAAGSLRESHFLIVNAEEISISFSSRCGASGSYTKQTLESHQKAEFSCERNTLLHVFIKTSIKNVPPSEVERELGSESRNELFWDAKNLRYDIREIQ